MAHIVVPNHSLNRSTARHSFFRMRKGIARRYRNAVGRLSLLVFNALLKGSSMPLDPTHYCNECGRRLKRGDRDGEAIAWCPTCEPHFNRESFLRQVARFFRSLVANR